MEKKTKFNKVELKKIREAIIKAQKKPDHWIFHDLDPEKIESLINYAFLDSFGVDIFDNAD